MILAYLQDGLVFEIIQPFLNEEGAEVPMSERFPATFIEKCVDVTTQNPMPEQGWVATDTDGAWSFAPYVAPPLTAEQVRAINAMRRDTLLKAADLAVNPLQDAVDLEVASAVERSLLTQWKQYRVAVNRVDLTGLSPAWPAPPVSSDYSETSPVTTV